MRIATITTTHHNVGDDFAREGIMHLVDEAGGGAAEYVHIHKHLPITSRRNWAWLHNRGVAKALDRLPGMPGSRLAHRLDALVPLASNDAIRMADLVIQCGAPIYWRNEYSTCATAEWVNPLLRRRVADGGKRLFNIGGGTCQGYHSNGGEVSADEAIARFIRWYCDIAELTIVRDRLSAQILEACGRKALLLPCPSLFARDRWGISEQDPEYAVVNLMPLGGHYDLDGDLKPDRWQQVLRQFVPKLHQQFPCVIACHSKNEANMARELFPSIPLFFSPRFQDYLPFYSKARFGIGNRVHGAFAMASFGRPSLVVGTDSRAHMVEMIGLQHRYLNDISAGEALNHAQRLESSREAFARQMISLRETTRKEYLEALGKRLSPN